MEDRIDRIARMIGECGGCLPNELSGVLAMISVSPYYSSFKKSSPESGSVEQEFRSICTNTSGAFLPEVFVRRYRGGKMTAGYEFVDCVGMELEYPWWHDYECYPQDSIVGIREELATIAEDIAGMVIDERNRAMELHSMTQENGEGDSDLSGDQDTTLPDTTEPEPEQ